MQPSHAPHQPPPPGPHIPTHGGMPMSPRNAPSSLQGPGTPTMSHALPNPAHPPHPPPVLSHTPSAIGLTSPPATPSSATIPTNRLNAGSSTFVPRSTAKVTLKKEDGTEVNIENLKSNVPASVIASPSPQGSGYRQGSPGTPNRRPVSIRMETEDQRKSRLAEEEQKEKEKARLKAEAEEKVRKEKEEAERKVKEAEEKKKKEEDAEKERVRLEEEEKEKARRAKEEEERLLKEAEERQLREEEERKRKEAEAEAKRIAEEKAKKEEEERLQLEREEQEKAEKERLEKEKAEQERLAKEAEEATVRQAEEQAAKEKQAAPENKSDATPEEGEVIEDGKDVDVPASKEENPRESLRINTGAVSPAVHRTRPGPLDLSGAKAPANIAAAQSTALATARVIADINTVQYPEGVSSPRPDLNQGAKDGKFRCVDVLLYPFFRFHFL